VLTDEIRVQANKHDNLIWFFSLCLYRVSVNILFGPEAKILNLKARDT